MEGITVTVTKPDNKTETLGPYATDLQAELALYTYLPCWHILLPDKLP